MSFNARVIDSAGRLYLGVMQLPAPSGCPILFEKHLVEPLQKLVDGQI